MIGTITYTSPISGHTGNTAAYEDMAICVRGLYSLAASGRRGSYYHVGGNLYGVGDLYRIHAGAMDAVREADPTQRIDTESEQPA